MFAMTQARPIITPAFANMPIPIPGKAPTFGMMVFDPSFNFKMSTNSTYYTGAPAGKMFQSSAKSSIRGLSQNTSLPTGASTQAYSRVNVSKLAARDYK